MLVYGADHVEAALGLDLPAFVRRLPAFDWIRYLACEHIGLLNDIFSIAKDCALDNTNAVALVRREQQCDLDTAVEYVNMLLTRRIEAIAEQDAALSRQLAVAGADRRLCAQVQTWLAGIKSLVRGNHDWHFEVARYNAPDTLRDGRPSYVEDLFAFQNGGPWNDDPTSTRQQGEQP